jgi:hypothetical protein
MPMERVSVRAHTHLEKTNPDEVESRFRLKAAWALCCAAFLGLLGASWDIQWHAAVGPDSFLTPSHGVLYLSRILLGFVALYVLILTTLKYRKGVPGVSSVTTTPWFKVLHAPVGFIIAGLGVASFIMGGFYDLWWHTIYGFDVTLLSPSHFALGFGAAVTSLGMIYIFASESNRESLHDHVKRFLGFSWANVGVALSAAFFITDLGIFTQPGLHEAIFAGGILVYPVAIALITGVGFFTAASFLRRPGVATLTGLLFTGIRLIGLHWPTFMTEVQRQADGLPFKVGGFRLPVVGLTLPAYLILIGLVIDLILYVAQRYRLNVRLSVAVAAAAGVALNFILDPRWQYWVDYAGVKDGSSKASMLARMNTAAIPSMLVAILIGVLVAWFSWGIGNVLRHTNK